MKRLIATVVFIAAVAGGIPTRAADDAVERLATCQDSWFDWKDDAPRMQKLVETFRSLFKDQKSGDAFIVPKSSMTVVGLPVTRVYPESVGMGVGFSLFVEATFDETKSHLEKAVGKSMKKCDTSDNMRACELEIGEKRTLSLLADDKPQSKNTLIGCYYFYAK